MEGALPSCVRAAAALAVCVLLQLGLAQADPEPATAGGPTPVLVAEVGHSGPVRAVAISRDGRWVLTASDDGSARLWQADSGKEVRRFEGYDGGVSAVDFDPAGGRVLTAGTDSAARLWDMATGRVVKTLLGHTGPLTSAAWSPSGSHIVAGGHDGTASLWDVQSGRRTALEGHRKHISAVAWSRDGRFVATGSLDGTVRTWDPTAGRALQTLGPLPSGVTSVAFAPVSTHVAAGTGDKQTYLFHVPSGRPVVTYRGHSGWVQTVAFSPDGRYFATGSDDRTALVFEARTGQLLQTLAGHALTVTCACFAPDSNQLLTGSVDRTVKMWNIASAAQVQAFEGHANDILSVAYSSDGRYLLTGSAEGIARSWDTEASGGVARFDGHSGQVDSVAYSPDCSLVLTGAEDKTARIWAASSGQLLRPLVGHEGCVCSAAFSPDGATVLTASLDKSARLWNAATGIQIRRFDAHSLSVNAATFSPDGTYVLTGSGDETARLWESATGAEVRVFRGHADRIEAVAFAPDGSCFVTGSRDRTAAVWDITGSSPRIVLRGHRGIVSSVLFLQDGRRVVTGSWDGTIRLWDVATGKELRQLIGHASDVTSLALSPDGTRLLSGSLDGTTRVWDLATGAQICSLMSFRDGAWAVTDPTGRFDASQGGDIRGLHWVIGLEVIALDQLKARYYEPGLLSKLLGHNPEQVRDVAAFTAPELYPDVQIENRDGKLKIQLDDLGGGIGEVVIMVNGKERTPDARGGARDSSATQLTLEEDLRNDPRMVPGQTNTIEVFARNREGYLRSRGVVTEFEMAGATPAPQLYAIVAGVSNYRGEALDLGLAAADAQAFAQAVRVGGEALFGAAATHVTVLLDAKRSQFLEALAQAKQAHATDVLVVYLAGHGISRGDHFYFLTAEAESGDLTDPAVRQTTTVSQDELITAINAIPALKQVLILDTCASGQLVTGLGQQRSVPSSQLRALERVKDRTGMFVLAGCAADRVSYEDPRFGHGLLTYSLLQGMRGGQLSEGSIVEVGPLLQFAADQVRELAALIGGVQEPSVAAPRGGTSFPIGMLDEAGRAAIELKAVQPVFIRSTLFNPAEGGDILGLGARVDAALRDRSARGGSADLRFFDSAALENAFQITGTYRVVDELVTTRFRLRSNKTFVSDWIELSAAERDLPERIVAEARRCVP